VAVWIRLDYSAMMDDEVGAGRDWVGERRSRA
jgi:hypothetical protein